MKPKLSPRFKFVLAGILFVWLGSSVSYGQEAASYRDYVKSNENSELVSLASDLHPSIYLNDGEMKKYGEGAAVTLFTDAASIPMLYATNPAFGKVELIKITIKSATDEAVILDLLKAASFTSLKYVLCIYQYASCGGKSETCLPSKTDKLCKTPAESTVKVLYQLSIPE